MPGPGYKRKDVRHKGGKKRKGNPFADVGGAIGNVGGESAHAGGGSRHNIKKNRHRVRRLYKATTRRENREARRDFRKTQYNQTLTERKAGNKVAYKPTEADVLGDQIEADIRRAAPGAINEGLAKASEVAHPIAEAMTWIGGPEVKGGTTLLKTLGKIVTRTGAKEATRVGEKAAAKAAAKEGEKVAVRAGAKEATKTATKREAKRSARRAAKKGQKAVDEAIEKTSKKRVKVKAKEAKPSLKSKAKSTAKRQFKKHRPTITSGKDAIKGAAMSKVGRAAAGGAVAAPVVAGPAAGVVESTGRALVDDPGETLKTTAAAIPGLVTAPVKFGLETVESAKNVAEGKSDPFAPLKAEGEAQLDYYKDWAKIAKGGEEGEKLVREKYGLTPAITGALGIHAATRPLRALKSVPDEIKEPRLAWQGLRVRRTKKLREEAGSTDPDKAEAAQQALMAAERRKGHKRRRVAQEEDVANRRARAQFARDMREPGEAAGKKKSVSASMRTLAKVPINDKGTTLADAVQLVHTYGIPLDAKAGRAALIEVRDSLVDANDTPAPAARATRDVLDALIENPELLEHSDFRRLEQSLGAIRRDQASAENPPDPADRARLVPAARTHGVATPEERIPHELREIVGAEPKKYRDAGRRMRARVKTLRKQAANKEIKAKAFKKGTPQRERLEAQADALRVKAQQIEDVVKRPQLARKLEAQAHEAASPAEAQNLKQAAQAIRREHQASQDKLNEEFHAEMNRTLGEKGLRQPIFFHDHSAADVGQPTRGGKPVSAAGAAKADKQKLGQLREMGLVDESGNAMIESIFRDRANAEMNSALQRILGEFQRGPLLTGAQAREMMRNGEAPAGHSLIPLQDFKRAYARGEWQHALGLIEDGMRDKIAEADFKGKGKKYGWIPTSVLDEVYAQAKGVGKVAKSLKAFGGAQSFLLLGTSPTWAVFQGFATPLVLMARHPNPVTWMKAAKHAYQLWRKTPKRERDAFMANFGGNLADVQGFTIDQIGPTFQNIRSMSDASKVARKTWAGRMLHNLVKGGGPLIRGVANYEAGLRSLEALMEADKLYGRTSFTKWAHSLAGLDAATRKQIDEVSRLSPSERIKWLADPKNTREVERRVMSTIGDWTSMTAFEKKASGAFIFYPFLRFSLKWMFHTFPRDNPIKAAVLLNLAQQNSQEVRDMLGGTPSFFQSYGLVPFRNREGEVKGAINLARAAPGSNALIEGIGGNTDVNISTLSRVFQPALATLLLQGAGGLDPFTGEKIASSTGERALLVAQQILGLNTFGRAFALPALEDASDFLAPSPTSEFFRQLDGRTPAERAFLPNLFATGSTERAKTQAGEILDKAGSGPTDEEIGDMAELIANKYPDENKGQLKEHPEVKAFIQRARKADKNSDLWQSILENAGLGSDPEVDRTFGNLMSLVKPIGGFNQKPIDRRTEAQRVRFLRRKKGLSNAEIERNYPRLPTSYDARIETLRRSGMSDREIAAKYPYLRKHLSSLQDDGLGGGGGLGKEPSLGGGGGLGPEPSL